MRMVQRLGREDWIAAGFAALVSGGPQAVAVQALARRLGVTKGSFYWHFRDRAGLRDAMLDHWEHRMTAALVRRARREGVLRPGAVRLGEKGQGAARTTAGPAGRDQGAGGDDRMPAGQAALADRGGTGAQGGPAAAPRVGSASGEEMAPERLLPALRIWAREDAAVARRLAQVRDEAGLDRLPWPAPARSGVTGREDAGAGSAALARGQPGRSPGRGRAARPEMPEAAAEGRLAGAGDLAAGAFPRPGRPLRGGGAGPEAGPEPPPVDDPTCRGAGAERDLPPGRRAA